MLPIEVLRGLVLIPVYGLASILGAIRHLVVLATAEVLRVSRTRMEVAMFGS
jgi:hypothetical protein